MHTIFIDAMNILPCDNSIWNSFYNVMFNTGNLVFSEYCKRGLVYSDVCKLNIDWASVSRDAVYVLPLANNFSSEDTYFTRLLYRLARYNLNIVPIGLGVQTDLNDIPKEYVKKIPGRKIRLLQMLAANTETIGVRGAFTAECMELIGVKNVRVIGCPSYYSKFLAPLNEKCGVSNNYPLSNVCMNWDLNSITTQIKMRNYKEVGVIQTLPEYVSQRKKKKTEKIFFSIEEWGEWIQKGQFAYALGDRFHGNMMCYLNNVKTLWINKDRCTAELVETLGLPCFCGRLKGYVNVEELFSSTSIYDSSYSKILDNRLLQNYIIFLNENRINHKYNME